MSMTVWEWFRAADIREDLRAPPEAGKPSEDPRSSQGEKWRTVRFALESWDRTARMCVIYLTLNVPVEILAWLIRH